MRQIRFRFDGQPINEADTPAQVWQPQALVGHLSVRGGLLLGGSVFKFRDSLFQMGRKPLRDILPRVGRCGAWAGAGAQAAGQRKSGPGPGPAGADPGRGHGPGPRHSWARQPHDPEPPTVGVFLALPRKGLRTSTHLWDSAAAQAAVGAEGSLGREALLLPVTLAPSGWCLQRGGRWPRVLVSMSEMVPEPLLPPAHWSLIGRSFCSENRRRSWEGSVLRGQGSGAGASPHPWPDLDGEGRGADGGTGQRAFPRCALMLYSA